jgi:TRAP transporter TAXI family solute receptor
MTKRLIALLMIAILAVSVFATGCNKETEPTDGKNAGDKPAETVHITIGTASVGGAFYPIGMQLAKIWNDNVPGVKAVAQATAGSPQNVELMGAKEMQIAIVRGEECLRALNGTDMYEGRPAPWIRAIMPLYYSGRQILALKNSGIDSVADFKGKTIAVGPIGSGGDSDSRDMLELYGMTYDDIKPEYVEAAQAIEMMKDGHVDAAFLGLSLGASAIAEIMMTGKAKMIEMEPEKVKEYCDANPTFTEYIIEAGLYPNQDYDVRTVSGPPMLLATHADVDEELVYNLVKAVAENEETFRAGHNVVGNWTPSLAGNEIFIDYHPGALKYWKEIGVVE